MTLRIEKMGLGYLPSIGLASAFLEGPAQPTIEAAVASIEQAVADIKALFAGKTIRVSRPTQVVATPAA